MTTELRDLLASAADDTTPHDLAGRATSGARRRRQQRLAVLGSVAAVTVLVAGAVVLGPLQQSGDEPRPQDVASLPSELPGPAGLPELSAGAMDAASTAFIVNGQLVLVDATTGEGAVWDGIEKSAISEVDDFSAALRPFQVRLSPDGTAALVAMRFETSQRLLGIRLAVLNLASAKPTVVPDLLLTDEFAESTILEYNVMAWEQGSASFLCSCAPADDWVPQVRRVTVTSGVDGDLRTESEMLSTLAPVQLSTGSAGWAIQIEQQGGPWYQPNGSIELGPSVPDATAMALGWGDGRPYLAVRGGRYVIGEVGTDPFDEATVAARGDLQHPSSLVEPTVIGLTGQGDGWVLVTDVVAPTPTGGGPTWPEGQRTEGPRAAYFIAPDGSQELFTTFPSGTTSTSFAAAVDAIG